MRPRRWTAVAASLAVAAVTTITGTGARADDASALARADRAPANGAPALAPDPAKHGYDITLITGDQVHVAVAADGRQKASVTAAPRGDGPPAGFRITEDGGQLTVLPSDVEGLVPGRLDPELFNVTALAAQGYTDERSDAISLIVTYGKQSAMPAVPALKAVRTLESIGGSGVRLAKSAARGFGGQLSALAAGRTKSPLDGVTKIWLDRKVEPALDRSVPQIGAPAAWSAGYDGAGTTVAVLDTGVDTGHPDLAGKVADERDFTDSGSATDEFGHGTHVADIIAGSGAASGGSRKGVAPGVKLLNGRVLDANGEGLSSWIIDGMEWAAGEKHADIVNMSLGDPSPGGPLTDALGALYAGYGTLFVVAAGNRGCEACVGSPGDAPAALTVGAVDGQDRLAEFSSFGPVGLERAVKPDITAPGVGIVAARAKGTSLGEPVDEYYTRLSGTSMATPHVAGAAALLRQSRPGISAGELKSLLMGTAKPMPDTPVDKRGTGRVDVATALGEPVLTAEGSVDFGLSEVSSGQPVTREVTYRNPGKTPVTLGLATGGPFSVSPAGLTLPGGAQATVRLTLDPAKAQAGRQRAELVATPRQGPPIRTSLTGNVEVKRVRLRVSGIARDGRPAQAYAAALNVDDGTRDGREMPGDPVRRCESDPGDSCVLVPPGTYSVLGVIKTLRPSVDSMAYGDRGTVLNLSFTGEPELKVTGDTKVVLDARKAVEMRVDTPDHVTKRNRGTATKLIWTRAPAKGSPLTETILQDESADETYYLQPTKRVTKGRFAVATRWHLEAPAITLRTAGLELNPDYVDPVWFSDVSADFPRLDGSALLPAVDAGTATPADLKGRDLRGRLALIRRTADLTVAAQSNAAAAAGARMVAVYGDLPVSESGVKLKVPTVALTGKEGARLAGRLRRLPVPVLAKGVVASPYVYDLYLSEEGRIRDRPDHTLRTKSLARVDSDFFSQLADDVTLSENRFGWQPWETTSWDTGRPVPRTPRDRVDYLTAGPGVRWSSSMETPERPYNYTWEHDQAHIGVAGPDDAPFRAGERIGRTWFKQPLLPGPGKVRPLRREGDLLQVDMWGLIDAGRNTGVAQTDNFETGMKTGWRLYQGETLLAQTERRPQGILLLPAAAATYRMEYDVENRATWARLSTRTKTAWTFPSQHDAGSGTTIPLLLADYDVATDLKNQATSPRLGLTLRHQDGSAAAPIKDVSLEVSYDDGASWRAVRRLISKGNGAYEATLDRPRSAALVSLRLKATDTRGASLSQEVIRAYALR
ncbi:S8 family serine peptidase [Nonomuraea sp. NPDC049750]|uniref:S8 family peptidase n=1 Tax=Nonomuraea sp. NPDC049750 TaxID=3154738 RepID=UPI0033D49FA6